MIVCHHAIAHLGDVHDPAARNAPRWRGLHGKGHGQTRIGELVLISTIDVYVQPVDVDEDSPIDAAANHAYGRHRKQLEDFCTSHHDTRVVRLPGLFGKGLKKNVIFDLLHDNQVDRIDPDAAFQYYDLRRLADDLDRVRRCDLRLLNVATPAIQTRRIAEELFGRSLAVRPGPHGRYDMQTRHGALWGRPDRYLQSEAAEWSDLAAFVQDAQSSSRGTSPGVV